MTDSICHSSLPHSVLEKVTLTTIKFRIYLRTKVEKVTLTTIKFCIYPCTKVDPMFYCVYISTPLKSYQYKSSATCA